MPIPTFAGQPSRSETYAQLQHHLIQCQELAAVMSHLHNTEHSLKDRALAKGWLAVSDNFRRLGRQLTTLAMGTLQ